MSNVLHGKVNHGASLKGSLSTNELLSGTVESKVEVVTTTLPYYDGPTEAVPDMEETTLKTKNRSMRSDVTLKAIPVYTVSNNSGGNTVTIGGLTSYE